MARHHRRPRPSASARGYVLAGNLHNRSAPTTGLMPQKASTGSSTPPTSGARWRSARTRTQMAPTRSCRKRGDSDRRLLHHAHVGGHLRRQLPARPGHHGTGVKPLRCRPITGPGTGTTAHGRCRPARELSGHGEINGRRWGLRSAHQRGEHLAAYGEIKGSGALSMILRVIPLGHSGFRYRPVHGRT